MTRPLVLVAVALAIPAAAAPRRRSEPCPAGRFLVQGAPLLAGASSSTADAIEVGTTRIVIGTACAAVAPKQFKGTPRGTKIKATWRSCTGFTGKVTLSGTIVDECATLRGTVKAKRFRGTVQGRRSSCGDGVVDAGGGEQCDPPAGGSCDAQCRRLPGLVTATIGAAGGRIVSEDNRLTLDVPPGALTTDTTISVRRAEASELPAELGAVDGAYDLGPDGLQFQAPVTATYQLEAPLGPGGELSVRLETLATVSAEGTTPEPLGEERIVVDGVANTAAATGTLTHFTWITKDPMRYGDAGRLSIGISVPQKVAVKQSFRVRVEARRLSRPRPEFAEGAVLHNDRTVPGVIRYGSVLPILPIGRFHPTEDLVVDGDVPYECGPTPGKGTYRGRVLIQYGPPADFEVEIECTAPTTTTSSTTTSSMAATSTTSTTTISTTTTTVVTTTTTTRPPRTNCCDCPLPQGCTSGPDVQPGDCVPMGCVFVTNAVCTDVGDCAGVLPTTSSSTTSSSTTTTSSTTSTSSTTTTSSSSTTSSSRPPAPIAFEDPEGIVLLDDGLFEGGDDDEDEARLREANLAGVPAGTLVSVAARNGWAIVDYVTGEIVVGDYLTRFPSPLFEASPLGGSSGLGVGLDVQAIVQVGPGGPAITHYDLAAGQFGFTQISPGSPTCFDAVAYGGDALSGGMVLACGRRLSTVEPDASGFFNGGTAYSPFPTTEGMVVSGFRRSKGGPIVAVTEGSPGKIWKHPATGASGEVPQELGAAQDSPRRVRCTPNSVCAVSNFGSDSLTILTWDATDAVAIVGTVSVGDGPVGIDIRPRTDGNVEVVSSGFNDDSYSITVLGQNGGTVSNEKRAAPAGCAAPGHAIWGPGSEIILSCNGSDNIALVTDP